MDVCGEERRSGSVFFFPDPNLHGRMWERSSFFYTTIKAEVSPFRQCHLVTLDGCLTNPALSSGPNGAQKESRLGLISLLRVMDLA